jgi:hypothetical protein
LQRDQVGQNVTNKATLGYFFYLTNGLYYKQVMIVIYDHNDSGQYYKTTITIIIDDPSLS